MAEGYCFKCKAKREIAEPAEERMKNGRKAIKGKCPMCGAVMFKILGGKVAAPVPPANPTLPPPTTPTAPTSAPAPAPATPAPAPSAPTQTV